MARSVKCAITKEVGTTETFIKVGNKYYKSKEIYNQDKYQKEIYRQIIDYICFELLDYSNGQPFHTSLPKILKTLNYYDNEVILKTFKYKTQDIKYAFQNKKFTSEHNKIKYMFAIINNSIIDINREWQNEQKSISKSNDINIEIDLETQHKQRNKDISNWLGGDDE